MARIYLPEKGSEYAPCEELCAHTDCKATREQLDSLCVICREPFGYGVPYYFVGNPSGGPDSMSMVHAGCEEERIATKRRIAAEDYNRAAAERD